MFRQPGFLFVFSYCLSLDRDREYEKCVTRTNPPIKLFVGFQHARYLLHDFSGSESVVKLFSDTYSARMIRLVSQSTGIDVDESMIVGSDFRIVQDSLSYGSSEGFFYLTW